MRLNMHMQIEKLIDPNAFPEAAARQTSQPWCSVSDGPCRNALPN